MNSGMLLRPPLIHGKMRILTPGSLLLLQLARNPRRVNKSTPDYITSGTTTTGGDTNIGYTGSPSTTGNKTQSAVTIVDSTMTSLSTITHMMVHEIGHTFGLDDCMSCTQGSSMDECLQE